MNFNNNNNQENYHSDFNQNHDYHQQPNFNLYPNNQDKNIREMNSSVKILIGTVLGVLVIVGLLIILFMNVPSQIPKNHFIGVQENYSFEYGEINNDYLDLKQDCDNYTYGRYNNNMNKSIYDSNLKMLSFRDGKYANSTGKLAKLDNIRNGLKELNSLCADRTLNNTDNNAIIEEKQKQIDSMLINFKENDL